MNDTTLNHDFQQNDNNHFNNKKHYDKSNRSENQESVFNVRVKAGSRRTYFFDVKTNRKEDYFIIITERRKRFDDEKSFDKNKIFLYKEDFNKFFKGLSDTIEHVKTELMPDFDFSVFDREYKPYDASSENQEEIKNNPSVFKQFDDNDTL